MGVDFGWEVGEDQGRSMVLILGGDPGWSWVGGDLGWEVGEDQGPSMVLILGGDPG